MIFELKNTTPVNKQQFMICSASCYYAITKPINQTALIIDILTMARTMQTTRKFTAVPLTKRQRQEIAVWKAERDKLITTYPKTPPHPIIKKKPISKSTLKQAKLAKIT